MSATNVQFVDGLPPVKRTGRTGGVWAERLEPLQERPGEWALVYETTAPHAMVSNLGSGKVAGFDPDDYQFAGRVVGTKEVEEEIKDENGDPTGETEIVEKPDGQVYARYIVGVDLSDEDEDDA